MKNSILKFACVFIILMFCLAPLSAADLSQYGNNNKYINQDEDVSIDSKDANITTEEYDSEIKEESAARSVDENELDDAGSAEAGKNNLCAVDDDENKIIAKGIDNKSSNLKGFPAISVHVEDAHVGESAVIKLDADQSVSMRVKIFLRNSGWSQNKYAYITNGHGELVLNDLPGAGSYKVVVYDENQVSSLASTTFNINKFDPNLSINVSDISVGEKLTVVAGSNLHIDQVIVKLSSSDKEYPVEVLDYTNTITIDEDLPAGEYIATVSYAGDNKFAADSKSTTFRVNKLKSEINVTVDDIEIGEKPTVNIQTPFESDRLVKFQLYKGSTIINTTAEYITYSQSLELFDSIDGPGEYTVKATFAGCRKYEASESTASFMVSEKAPALADPNLSIKVNNIIEGEKAVAVISANKTLNGEARVYLNHSNAVYPVSIVNGSGNVTIDEDLAPGDYLATVRFLGDDTFKESEDSTSFQMKRLECDDFK